MPRIGLVHALRASMEPIDAAFRASWPQAETIHLFDQSLYVDYERIGRVTPQIEERIKTLLHYSAGCQADAILFTGSLFGEAVEQARTAISVPVLGAYEAMIEQAFSRGSRFVLLATVADTLSYLQADMERYARQHDRDCDIHQLHVEGALAMMNSDRTTHDRLIVDAAAQAPDCDALLLGQFSMAPVAGLIHPVPGRVVLNSPDAAVAKLLAILTPSKG